MSSNGQDASVTPAELDSLIAGNVRAARARRRLRQEDLADDMEWTRAMVTSLESGTRRVTLADAVALCRALKIDMRELLRGAPDEVLQVLGL
jgi:transcriptional regulator with XRE-family HTH domain